MCSRLDEPVDGFLRITGLAVEAETVYFCDPGFQRNGLLRRECLPTGNWSGQETVCDRELPFSKRIERMCIYSETSDKEPSEIGTTSLQRTLVAAPC